MSVNYEIIDSVYRSRITLLEHLEKQGYDTAPYMKFSPKEIQEMVKAGPAAQQIAPALQMELKRKEEDEVNTCVVIYFMTKIKQKLTGTSSVINKFVNEEETGWPLKSTEFIFMTFEPIAPNFDAAAADAWVNKKIRVRFFQVASCINNPLKHILVPPHEKVPKEQHETLLKEWFAEKKSQFPSIRFHEDPIARWLGLLPGDIVKITRPSPTAGTYVSYRVCVA
jgi:DNA-directed RNA polymerase subunit H (RpoH/RPB5)